MVFPCQVTLKKYKNHCLQLNSIDFKQNKKRPIYRFTNSLNVNINNPYLAAKYLIEANGLSCGKLLPSSNNLCVHDSVTNKYMSFNKMLQNYTYIKKFSNKCCNVCAEVMLINNNEIDKECQNGWMCSNSNKLKCHFICDTDICMWVSSCIMDGRYPIVCPFQNCKDKITDSNNNVISRDFIRTVINRVDAKNILPQNPTNLLQKFNAFVIQKDVEDFLSKNPYMHIQKCLKCDNILSWDRTIYGVPLIIKCGVCNFEFCSGCGEKPLLDIQKHISNHCKRIYHYPYDSNIIDHVLQMLYDSNKNKQINNNNNFNFNVQQEIMIAETLDLLYKEGQSVKCPKCGFLYAKDDSTCTHINCCLSCNSSFCYTCGKLCAQTIEELEEFRKLKNVTNNNNNYIIPQCSEFLLGNNALCDHTKNFDINSSWTVESAQSQTHCPLYLSYINLDLNSFHAKKTKENFRKIFEWITCENLISILSKYGKHHIVIFLNNN